MSVNKYNPTTGNLERLDGYTVDSTPTQNSGNPVSSGGVFTALAGKLDKADEGYVDIDFSDIVLNSQGWNSLAIEVPENYVPYGFTERGTSWTGDINIRLYTPVGTNWHTFFPQVGFYGQPNQSFSDTKIVRVFVRKVTPQS